MVSLLLAGIPSSSAYTFIGEPHHLYDDDEPATEEPPIETTPVEEPTVEETPAVEEEPVVEEPTESLEDLVRNLADCVDNDALNTLAECLNVTIQGIDADAIGNTTAARYMFTTLWTVKSAKIKCTQSDDCKRLVAKIVGQTNCTSLATLKADYQLIVKAVLSCLKEEVKEPELPKTRERTASKPVVREETTLPAPQEEVEKSEPVLYIELNYEDIDKTNPYSSLPESKSGNYILVYSTATCPACDRLINDIKGKTDCPVVRIKCKSYSVKDLYYERMIRTFPSWLTIKNNTVTYYGYGYRSLEGFKGLFK